MKSEPQRKDKEKESHSLCRAIANPPQGEIIVPLTGWKTRRYKEKDLFFIGFSQEPIQLPNNDDPLYIQARVKRMTKRRRGAYYGEIVDVCLGYPREIMEGIAVWVYLKTRGYDEQVFPKNPDLSNAERETLLRAAGKTETVKAIVDISMCSQCVQGFSIYQADGTQRLFRASPLSPLGNIVLYRHAEAGIMELLSAKPQS